MPARAEDAAFHLVVLGGSIFMSRVARSDLPLPRSEQMMSTKVVSEYMSKL